MNDPLAALVSELAEWARAFAGVGLALLMLGAVMAALWLEQAALAHLWGAA